MDRLILAIEDEEDIARLYVQLFEDDDIVVVKTAVEGIEALRRLSPSVILLDLGLRRSRGEDVVRAIGLRGRPPIIVVSGVERASAFAQEIDAPLIQKPFDLVELAVLVDRLTSGKS